MALIDLAQALSLIDRHRLAQRQETTPIAQAHGRTLAEDVIAKVSRPPLSVSAMDGYAVRLCDTTYAGTALHLIGEAPAGTPFPGKVGKGEAVRIFTGGAVPDGADHIIIQEDMQQDGTVCRTTRNYTKPHNIRAAGLDFQAGDLLLRAGVRLGAAQLSTLAAANLACVKTYTPLRVGILANGDELQAPGSTLQPGQIVNSNPIGLSALIRNWGGMAIDLGVARDSVDAILSALDAAPDIDIFVPVGGASVGAHDYMRTAFFQAGFTALFENVAVRPGKPTWFAENGTQRVLGLPGNPASAFVCAHLFLAPLLGHEFITHGVSARLTHTIGANGPRTHLMRARACLTSEGALTVTAKTDQDSSLLTPLLTANALILRPPSAPASEAGETVEVLPLHPLYER